MTRTTWGALLLPLTTLGAAAPTDRSTHKYGVCQALNIPITATAPSAVYNQPTVSNDIQTTNWTIWMDTWSTPQGINRIIKNTTTSGTYSIHLQLCVPNAASSTGQGSTLQVATHGEHYDSRYWDSTYKPEKHSYVEASLKAGYSVLTYDRLGAGQSDHPDAYSIPQAPFQLEILKQITLMARNGTLYSTVAKACPAEKAFAGLKPPAKVVHIGHSFGSYFTSSFIANYPNLSDGAIITGFVLNEHLSEAGFTSFEAEYAATAGYDRGSGYMVMQKRGIQTLFFGGNPPTAFSPELLDYGDSIKQPFPAGELVSSYTLLDAFGPFEGPIQYLLPENDFFICGGDCNGVYSLKDLKKAFPKAADIKVDIQPNTGHALPLHYNATAGFQLTFDFLAKHGL